MLFTHDDEKWREITRDAMDTADNHHDALEFHAMAAGAEVEISDLWLRDFSRELVAGLWRNAIQEAKNSTVYIVEELSLDGIENSTTLADWLADNRPPGRY